MDCRQNRVACRGGLILIDKDRFCEEIRLCEKAMYYVAFSVTGSNDDAAEIISEAIYRAYKNLDSLKNEGAFKAWILRIVHNTAVETVRKNSKIIPLEENNHSFYCEDENLTERLDLQNAVNRLKQPYRTVVVLFYYENLSAAEIAKITASNVAAVKKQLSRARNMLRESLKEDFNQ